MKNTWAGCLFQQAMICADMKGMKVKPGSLGKAAPPYNTRVRWSPFLFAVDFIGSKTQESTTYCTSFGTIQWYSGQADVFG